MKSKKIKLFSLSLLFSGLAFSQKVESQLSGLNNAYWQISKLKAKKEIKESFYKSSGATTTVQYQKAFFIFSKDSLVFLKICGGNKKEVSTFHFKIKGIDSVEFYGPDKYKLPKERETHKYPYFRKFKSYYMFSYLFKARRIDKTEIYFYCKKPKIKLRLRYLKEYINGEKIVECDDW